jgi:transcriptional regulator GlxA family with amidase domain
LTIWIAHSSSAVAAEVAERLRRLDVTVRMWDGVSSLPAESRGLVVADSASLQRMARGVRDNTAERDTKALSRTGTVHAGIVRGGLTPGALRRVMSFIEDSLFDKIDIAELATIAELSECHFSRAFRQSVGTPPHRYILSRRVAAAGQLVAETNRSLTDIALAVGFSDHSHFTRSFVRLTGETPRDYRHRHR